MVATSTEERSVTRWRYFPDEQKKRQVTDAEWAIIKADRGWETDPIDPRDLEKIEKAELQRKIEELERALKQVVPDDQELPSLEATARYSDIDTEIENLTLQRKALKQNFHATTDVALKHRFNQDEKLAAARIELLEVARNVGHDTISYGNHLARGYRIGVPLGEGIQFDRYRYETSDPLEKVILDRAIAHGEPGLRRIATGASPYFDLDTGRFVGWKTDAQLEESGEDVRTLRRG